MNSKIRFSLLVAGLVGLNSFGFAQTVEQGKTFYYYNRWKSAKETLEKVLASNPNNIDAIYWLGQTLIQLKDTAGAETLYAKALQSNGSAPMLLAGMGEIEIRKGKTADARQRFETAISLSKSKDVNVLNAVGEANVAPKEAGDIPYAIEKLNLATQIKNFHSPETYIILGDAYRKIVDGGNAVQSYQKALTIEPKYAAAKYKIGLIYYSQNNKEYFIPAFEEAVQMDPNYGPAFYALYLYYFNRDINKARDYFDKYLAVSDPNPENDYDKASIRYASKDYNGCIQESKSLLAKLGDAATPKYYKLIAYCYDALNDSTNAKSYIDQYFAKQKPDDFLPMDHVLKGKVLGRFPGNEAEAFKSYATAIDKDTAYENKVKFAKEAADLARKLKSAPAMADFAGRLYGFNKNPNQTDVYNWGIANYQAGNYKTADSIFCGIYESKYPNEIFGYLWCARSLQAQDDSLMSQGLAIPAYDKLAQVARMLDSTAKVAGSADSIKYKKQVIDAYFTLASFYNDRKKDKQTAVAYLQKVLEVDPGNATATQYIGILTRPARQPANKPKTPGTSK